MSWQTPSLPFRLAAARSVPLVGRRYELETFEEVWADVVSGHRQVVFLGGEPGAGKSRLAAEIAGVLLELDVAVLVGTSTYEAGVPYQPFAEMLDQVFLAAEPGSLDEYLAESGAELARLSVHAARHHPGLDTSGGRVADVRRDLFDAVSGLFRDLSKTRPIVIVLDDLHWAQRPTIALLEHVIRDCIDIPLLVVGTFRTTAPDRSEELSARIAELHRLDGVRRLDLSGLDTDAIAEYLTRLGGVSIGAARAPSVMLRDRTGGNPFFLRELWIDLQRRGGVSALRAPGRVPASISDTIEGRLAGLGTIARPVVEVAAVIGDSFDVATLLSAGDVGPAQTMDAIDAAIGVGLIEPVGGQDSSYSFIHSLTRQTVLDRMPPSRVTLLHAKVGAALERWGSDPSYVPRLAHHYLAAHILGHHDQAVRYAAEAGTLATRSLAFEEAAMWFERAASLPESDPEERAELLFDAATNHLRAGDFARARAIYDRLAAMSDPMVGLRAAVGYEDANWRPGLANTRAADLLTTALDECRLDETDPRYVHALGSLGRALAFAGETQRAREVGTRAIELAARQAEPKTVAHTLKTSLWHGLTPDMAELQLARATELCQLAKQLKDYDSLGSAAYFRAMVSYLRGQPHDLEESAADGRRSAEANGQPFFGYVAGCVSQGRALIRGDFVAAERWAESTLRLGATFGVDSTEGPHGVQVFMIQREVGGLDRFRHHLDGRETFDGRWVPGMLALYTELGVEEGVRRSLRELMKRDLDAHVFDAQWPMELAFMAEGALLLGEVEIAKELRPFLARFQGMNVIGGQFIAPFGSADRFLGRIAALVGEPEQAERHFAIAEEMDRRMGAVIHEAETLAHWSRFLAARDPGRSQALARQARELASRTGQKRVLRFLGLSGPGQPPDGLSEREMEVLRLLAEGLSNKEIAESLFISANTAANHVRSILMKTGSANRTQAAIYASDHKLV